MERKIRKKLRLIKRSLSYFICVIPQHSVYSFWLLSGYFPPMFPNMVRFTDSLSGNGVNAVRHIAVYVLARCHAGQSLASD